MKKTVVVFYSEGYCDQVALALNEYYSTIADEVSVLLINEKQYTSFGARKFKDNMYRFSMRYFPSINRFGGFISYQYNEKFKNKFSKNAKETEVEDEQLPAEVKEESFKGVKMHFRKMDNILLRFNPDVVVCTTPVSLEKALKARERLRSSVQICVAITDYCTNRGMINHGVDKYIVQNSSIKQTLITFGIKEQVIKVAGTPICASITEKFDRAKVLEEFNIVNKDIPNVMIVAGRCGCARVIDAFKDLATYSNEMNLFVFANDSQNIHSFVKTYVKAAKQQENIYVIDEVNNMAKIYSIMDVIVTSPTAAITYEASVRGIPTVLLKPANQLEEGNYTYLSTNGYSFIGEKTSHLVPTVLALTKGENLDGTKLSVKTSSANNAKEYGDTILAMVSEDMQLKKQQKAASKKAKQEKQAEETKQAEENKKEEKPKKATKKKNNG